VQLQQIPWLKQVWPESLPPLRLVRSADAAPTEQSYAVFDELSARIDAELKTLERVLAEDVPAFNRLVREREIPAVLVPKP